MTRERHYWIWAVPYFESLKKQKNLPMTVKEKGEVSITLSLLSSSFIS